jgi:tRNA A-37 threonylcarbamoyl transferase component Bud32
VLKLFNQLDDANAFGMFSRELEMYRRLESCQGTVIPRLKQALLLSGFLYTLFLDNRGTCITKEQLIENFDKVKMAVQSIHKLGVLHNDLALRNILYHEGRVTLIDFGQSKFFDASYVSATTNDDYVIADREVWEYECGEELEILHALCM